jgi:predicted negative regulator of RcsB-dependent stress response
MLQRFRLIFQIDFVRKQQVLSLAVPTLILFLLTSFLLLPVYAQQQEPSSSEPVSVLIQESDRLIFEEKRYEEALSLLDKVPKTDPNYLDVLDLKASAFQLLGRYEEELAAYDEAISIDPNSPVMWNRKGYALFNLGRYEEAVAAYDEAIRLDPSFVNAWHNKAFALEEQGNFSGAIAAHYMYMALNSSYWMEQIIIALLIGTGAWFLGTINKINHSLTRFFFYIQRIPLTHFVLSIRTFDNERYFFALSSSRVSLRTRLISLSVTAIGGLGLVLEASCSLIGCSSGTQAFDPGSEFMNIDIRFYSWALTIPLVAFFMLPVLVIESVNARLIIKEKM